MPPLINVFSYNVGAAAITPPLLLGALLVGGVGRAGRGGGMQVGV
jgi:hypothetical protein